MSVLLIGSTGMGKSTLGNYLIDPSEKHMFCSQTFATATDNRPMTQEVKVECKEVQSIEGGAKFFLKLIDTPGLNEGASQDLSHMIDIIKKINECGEIKACILVVKFNAKIDMQYRATLEYYSKLLPSLFENNVIIIMTEFKTDSDSEELRKKLGIDVEQIKSNTIEELRKCSNKQITYTPQLFTIDCLAIQNDAQEISKKERAAILDYILQLQPIKVENLMVAKTDYVQQKDNEKYKELLGEIEGYNLGLIEAYKRSEDALNSTHKKELQITDIESEVKDLEEKLRQKNTTEEVVAAQLSINQEWKMLQSIKRDFKIESQYEVTNYTIWTNGKCEFKDIVRTSKEVSGRVRGEFMHGVYALVTAFTEKRIKYASEIEELKRKLEEEKGNLTRCNEERVEFRDSHKKEREEIELLEKFIAVRRSRAKKCRSKLMKIEDAIQRLQLLQ
uniref:AIG1-type G domain-containing protein n=1 Tax=Amphimedon queenslandica TaxID=400682 RepID=A0A1X7T0U1_AMPQE